MVELFDLRDKLRDFTARIRAGDRTYFKEIAIKLRILLCRKSRCDPLITTIERELGLEVYVWVSYTMRELVARGRVPATLGQGMVFEQINSVVTWLEGGHERLRLLDALDREEIFVAGECFSYKHVIEVAADKMGGAHVDAAVPDRDLRLHSERVRLGGLPIAQLALRDTALACIAIIDALEDAIKTERSYPFLVTTSTK